MILYSLCRFDFFDEEDDEWSAGGDSSLGLEESSLVSEISAVFVSKLFSTFIAVIVLKRGKSSKDYLC